MSELVNIALGYAVQCLLATSQQLALMLGPILVLGLLMNYISGYVEQRAVSLIGSSAYLRLFAWMGTAVHELGHALFCVIFRHQITRLVLFRPDPETGTLGYVSHAYDRSSTYQRIGNFFIGIGPIILGSSILYLAALYLLNHGTYKQPDWLPPPADGTAIWRYTFDGLKASLAGSVDAAGNVLNRENFSSWRFYVWLYISFSVGGSIKLSPPDIKGAIGGFSAMVGFLIVVNLATSWLFHDWIYQGVRSVAQFYTTFYSVMVFAIVVNAMAALLLLLISIFTRLVVHRRPWLPRV